MSKISEQKVNQWIWKMKAIRKSDGKIIDVEPYEWENDCGVSYAVSYHTNLKDFYKPEDLDFNIPQETEQSSSFDWQSFRAEAAKDILCAMIQSNYNKNRSGSDVEIAIKYADSLVNQLKEKEGK